MTELSKIMGILNEYESINDKNIVSSFYHEELFDSNYKCLIKKDADIIIPKYLVLHLNNDGKIHLINEIKEKIMFASLKCDLDNINIYNISLKLLLDLTLPRLINNKLYMLLPPYLFNKIVFNINNNNNLILTLIGKGELINIISRCSIILNKKIKSISTYDNSNNNIIYNENESYNDNETQIRFAIQQLRSLFIIQSSKSNIFTNSLQTKADLKGIFINANIYELTEIKIFIDYQVYFHYDKYSIHGYCTRINSNLLYLPLGNGCDYTSTEQSSFLNTINLNNVNSTTISLRFSVPQDKVVMHLLIKNEIFNIENRSKLLNYYVIDPLNITNSL